MRSILPQREEARKGPAGARSPPGTRLATVLRAALEEHYGIRSEKLAELGRQPSVAGLRKAKPGTEETPQVERPTPEAESARLNRGPRATG